MKTRISINKQISFEAAHRLRYHKGKCRSLHGHTYKVIASAEQNPDCFEGVQREEEIGMVADFGILSKVMKEVVFEGFVFLVDPDLSPRVGVPLDHSVILNVVDPLASLLQNSNCTEGMNLYKLAFEPTAENMAIMLMKRFQNGLFNYQRGDLLITKISLWETETNFAVVEAKDVEEKDV